MTRNISVNSVWHQLQFHNDIIISLEALRKSHINTKKKKKKYRRKEGINSSGNIVLDLVNIQGVFKLSIFACENITLSTH